MFVPPLLWHHSPYTGTGDRRVQLPLASHNSEVI